MATHKNELLEKKAEEWYTYFMEKPHQILSIFNDFFSEANVDMQGYPELGMFKEWLAVLPVNYLVSHCVLNKVEWEEYNESQLQNLTEDLIEKILGSPYITGSIGNAYFNNISILVHFPHVRVTNENNKYVDINHLWAKIKINHLGTLDGTFSLNRSEYTLLQFNNDYMHSHVSRIPRRDFSSFQTPCTGEGPINQTMATLNLEYNEEMWSMFCLELSKYVTVESVAGVPYHYLERIGTGNRQAVNRFFAMASLPYYGDVVSKTNLKSFVKHFIETKKLKFNYMNGSYSIGMTLPEYIILISNEFISWYNQMFNDEIVHRTLHDLLEHGFIKRCIISNNTIYSVADTNHFEEYENYLGKYVCTFKGKEVTLNITDIPKDRNDNENFIVNIQVALYILSKILKVLNYKYGKSTNNSEPNQLDTKTWYL